MNSTQEYLNGILYSARDILINTTTWQVVSGFTNKYLVSFLQKNDHTAQLVSTPISIFISAFFAYGLTLIVGYEIISYLGISLGWWKPGLGADDNEDGCTSHVFVSLNTLPGRKTEDISVICEKGLEAIPKKEYELEYPILFHFEISKDDYVHPDLGTNLKLLRTRVLDWFLDSQQYYLNKDKYRSEMNAEHVYLFDKDGQPLKKEESTLDALGIKNGHTIHAVIAC